MQNDKRMQKLITFSPTLYKSADAKAKRLGLSFPMYVRYLVVFDIKKEIESIPMVDEQTEKNIGKSLREIEKGDYYTIEPEEDVMMVMDRPDSVGIRKKKSRKKI